MKKKGEKEKREGEKKRRRTIVGTEQNKTTRVRGKRQVGGCAL